MQQPRHVVTIVSPGDDCDSSMARAFQNGQNAIDFAAACAFRIDPDGWSDCLEAADGDHYEALTEFNSNQRFGSDAGLMGNYVITISRAFSESYIFAACEEK